MSLFKAPHRMADGRLGEVQPICGIDQAAGPFDFTQNGQRLDVDHEAWLSVIQSLEIRHYGQDAIRRPTEVAARNASHKL